MTDENCASRAPLQRIVMPPTWGNGPVSILFLIFIGFVIVLTVSEVVKGRAEDVPSANSSPVGSLERVFVIDQYLDIKHGLLTSIGSDAGRREDIRRCVVNRRANTRIHSTSTDWPKSRIQWAWLKSRRFIVPNVCLRLEGDIKSRSGSRNDDGILNCALFVYLRFYGKDEIKSSQPRSLCYPFWRERLLGRFSWLNNVIFNGKGDSQANEDVGNESPSQRDSQIVLLPVVEGKGESNNAQDGNENQRQNGAHGVCFPNFGLFVLIFFSFLFGAPICLISVLINSALHNRHRE